MDQYRHHDRSKTLHGNGGAALNHFLILNGNGTNHRRVRSDPAKDGGKGHICRIASGTKAHKAERNAGAGGKDSDCRFPARYTCVAARFGSSSGVRR